MVPGYQFTYEDNSKEYITTNGSFMTIKKDKDGNENRISYVLDPKSGTDSNEIAYRIVKSEKDLKNFENLPIREFAFIMHTDGFTSYSLRAFTHFDFIIFQSTLGFHIFSLN